MAALKEGLLGAGEAGKEEKQSQERLEELWTELEQHVPDARGWRKEFLSLREHDVG